MKISTFAQANQVTVKCLRYYDEIGLLKPNAIHPVTGYREYSAAQSETLNWILILKNLGFNLASIPMLLAEEMSTSVFLHALKEHRMAITKSMNDALSKKVMIDRLIQTLEKEGFEMTSNISLLSLDKQAIHDMKKQLPIMEVFIENTLYLANLLSEGESLAFLRTDISNFKQVNDDYGYDVGDLVILSIYQALETLLEPFQDKATLGRAGGDEFLVSIICTQEELDQLCHTFIERVALIDFPALGCQDQKGVYVGAIVTYPSTPTSSSPSNPTSSSPSTSIPSPLDFNTIRRAIDTTWECIESARKLGKNAVYIHTPATL